MPKLLGIAVKSEIEASEFYHSMLDRDLPGEARNKVEKLAAQEKKHEKTLRSIFKDFYPKKDIEFPESSGLHDFPFDPLGIDENRPLENLFQVAMKNEKESERFYGELRVKFDDEEVRRLLGFLAANEREHYEILRTELNKLN
ncbi:MAG: ferritin family protein [Candidatus Bipolaricaulia bacterium]